MSRQSAYQPPDFDSPIDLDLSRNEGRPAFDVASALEAADTAIVRRYPRTEELRQVIASVFGVTARQVLPTAGADDALLRCFLARRGGRVVATTPSFEMIRRYAAQTGTTLLEAAWWDGPLPVDDLVSLGGDMMVLVSPNNPTGTAVTEAELEKIAGSFPLVVLDEAYVEFAAEDLTVRALELGNILVLRTLSKAYGLAGARVGYVLGEEELVAEIARHGNPYPVTGISASLAVQALTAPAEPRAAFVESVKDQRGALISLLERLGMAPLPSQANFVLATAVDPEWLVPAAAAMGVGLRAFPGRDELGSCVRITVPGDPEEYRRLVHVIETCISPDALIFDLDGVIADVSRSYRVAIRETAARFGVDLTEADIACAKRGLDVNDDWELTRRLCVERGADVSLGDVKEVFETLYQGDERSSGLREHERPLVDRSSLVSWTGRWPLAIVTGRPREDAFAFLDRFELTDLFETVVAREDAPLKPDPAPVILAMERTGARRPWMLGDTRDDLVAARRAGALPIAVLTSGADPTALSPSAMVLPSANDLGEVLDEQTI